MNQENLYYDMLFKRKSFHVFRDIGTISEKELTDIECVYETLQPLHKEIQTAIRIVPARETTCKRGQEYCILLYGIDFQRFSETSIKMSGELYSLIFLRN